MRLSLLLHLVQVLQVLLTMDLSLSPQELQCVRLSLLLNLVQVLLTMDLSPSPLPRSCSVCVCRCCCTWCRCC